MDSSVRQEKHWGWRRNPVRRFCHWSQRVVKLQPEPSRTFLPSSWPRQLIPAPPPELWQLLPCGHAACWGAPGPQVGCLSGSKVRGALSHYKSLLGDSSRLDPCKAVVKLHPSCWGLSCYCQHAVDEIGPWWNQLQTLSDGAGPGSLSVLLIVPQWRKNPTFYFGKCQTYVWQSWIFSVNCVTYKLKRASYLLCILRIPAFI